jgi:tetratricopeptide (TPR) repeat protein
VLVRGAERFEGLSILDEITDDLGLVLWRSLRNVVLWAHTPAGQRAHLFDGMAAPLRSADLARLAPEPELHGPLSVIVALLERPGAVDVPRLANACRRIALWAEDRGALATALDYAQAAALAHPESAILAYGVGRLARRRAEYDRAEGWFLRAIIQGRQKREWRAYTLAFSGLGNLLVQKGNFPEARRVHEKCLRAAVRYGLRELEGIASHDLFVIAMETGANAEAERHARQAFEAYAPGHHRIPRLAKDVAYLWILQGRFAQALEVARALLPHFPHPADRIFVLADIARSAGGAGEREVFEWAARETWAVDAEGSAPDVVARALLDVAHGAASLEDWTAGEQAAARALAVATERKEGKVVMTAEAVLDFVRGRMPTQCPPAPARDPSADEMAERFVSALRAPAMSAA